MLMINCESDLGKHPGPVTTGLRTIETTFPNGDTEKENSFLSISDGRHETSETCLLLRTEEVQDKLSSRMQDKMDLPKNVGLSESNTIDEKASDETKVNIMGESKTCTETDSFGTKIVLEKLCSRIQDKLDLQPSAGLSESGANIEKISDKTNFTTMGESEMCLEADILRTEEAEGKLCSKMQDKIDSLESVGLSESDANGEKICNEINVTTTDKNKTCLEMNENKCKKVESNDKQGSKDAAQSAGALCSVLKKPISDCNPVPEGGNAAKAICMPSAGTDKICGTNVSLTSTANRYQKIAANPNGGLVSGKTTEVNLSVNNSSIAASRLVVIKSKNDFTVSRSPSGTAANKTFRPVAKLLNDIGLDLVTEWVCQDLIHIQTQKTAISPLPEAEKNRQLSVLSANKQRLTKKNEAFAFRKRRCRCGFWSESLNVLAFHSQFGDVSRNGDMCCCLCSFTAQNPRCFNRHMKRRHKLKALVTVKVAQYQCHFCPFENNQQARVESHVVRCCKLFDLNFNLCPVRVDCDIPVFVTPDVQAKQSTVTSASAPGNHVFPTGAKPSQIPLHSNMPSCSLIIQQPQQCATIPSSVTLSLPLTRFIVAPSISPSMPRIQLSVVPPKKQNSAQPCSVVSPVVSRTLLPAVAPGQPLTLAPATRNSLHTNLIMSPSTRGLVLPTNLAQNLSQTGLSIPPLVAKDAPQSLFSVPSSVTLVQPEPCVLVPPGLGSNLLRMQLLASPQAPIVQFQNPRNTSGTETRFIQMGNQMCTIVQHQGRSVLTPLIFPRPILPFTPSFTLNPPPLSPSQPTVSSGKQDVKQNSAQLSSTVSSSNISVPRDTVSFVRLPKLQSKLKSKLKPKLPPPTNTNKLSISLEICELCDGFVKDRQSLSVHFHNAHRVVVNDLDCVVPSHSCSLCMQSFFTISGLLRHYHLVHASDIRLIKLLERCSLCQNMNVKNAVEHLSSHHRDTMSTSHEFKHCGICSLHLRDVQSFEKHMLLVHGNLFANRNILLATIAASLPDMTQRVCDSNPPGLNGQPKERCKTPEKVCHACKTCGTILLTAEELDDHIIANHMYKCSRCREAFNSLPARRHHFYMKHSTQREACPLCLQSVQIGRPFIRHMKSQHLRDCAVQIERMRSSSVCGKHRTMDSVKLANNSLKQISIPLIPVDNGSLKYDDDLSLQSAKRQKLE